MISATTFLLSDLAAGAALRFEAKSLIEKFCITKAVVLFVNSETAIYQNSVSELIDRQQLCI
jgi:hypothetical protein